MRRWRWRLLSLLFAFDNGDMSSPKRHVLIASFVIILLILITFSLDLCIDVVGRKLMLVTLGT